jgi:hypothetical protein
LILTRSCLLVEERTFRQSAALVEVGSNPTFAAGAQLDRLATAARP